MTWAEVRAGGLLIAIAVLVGYSKYLWGMEPYCTEDTFEDRVGGHGCWAIVGCEWCGCLNELAGLYDVAPEYLTSAHMNTLVCCYI